MPKLFSILFTLAFLSNTYAASIDDLFNVMDMEDNINSHIIRSVKIQVKNEKRLKPAEKELIKFALATYGWKIIKPKLKALWLKHYSSEDISKLLEFYKSETGIKSLKVSRTISNETQKIAQMLLRQNIKQYKQVVRKALKDNKANKNK